MIQAFLARQLARPSGLFGRWIMAPLLDRSNRAMNRLTFDQLAPTRGDRVLEVGFGGGELLAHILAGSCAFAAGVDPSPEMLARAKHRFRADLRAGRVELRSGTIEALPFPVGAFTKICSVNTLYFWTDVGSALRECRRVLEPGGVLVLCFNARADLERWPGHRHGFRLYDVSEVEQRILATGLELCATVEGEDPQQGLFYCVRARVPSPP